MNTLKKVTLVLFVISMMIFLFMFGKTYVQETFFASKSPFSRSISHNNLPISLKWSRQFDLVWSGENQICYGDVGAVVTKSYQIGEWSGLVLFDENGKTIWNHPVHQASRDLVLDGENVYLLESFVLYAYSQQSGMKLWETERDILQHTSHYLFTEDNELIVLSPEQVTNYSIKDGRLLSKETIYNKDLVFRGTTIDIHAEWGKVTYATLRESQQILWENPTTFVGGIGSRPQIANNYLIIQPVQPNPGTICIVDIDDGQTIWCEDKDIFGHIAVHDGLGYGLNLEAQLIAFRLIDGVTVGTADFTPNFIDFSVAEGLHVDTCNDHLVVYFSDSQELFWFDFLPE